MLETTGEDLGLWDFLPLMAAKESRMTELPTKEIEVNGVKVTLEERTCDGGCDRKFFTMQSSNHTKFFSDCFYRCGNNSFSADDKKLIFNQQYQMKQHDRRD